MKRLVVAKKRKSKTKAVEKGEDKPIGKLKRKGKKNSARKITDKSEMLVLRLYITGSTPQSIRALTNIKRICEKFVRGNYDLQVIDVYQNPDLARDQQIIAAPTLLKMLPLPLRRLIGDMSDENRVLLGLSIQPESGRALNASKKSPA
jgi:circadian clock protein KaiB